MAELPSNPDGSAPGVLPPFETPLAEFYYFLNGESAEPLPFEQCLLRYGRFDPRDRGLADPPQVRGEQLRALRDSLPAQELHRTLCCVGNGKPFDTTFGWRFGGISNGRWSLRRLADVLEHLGLGPDGPQDQLRVRGRDGWIRNFSQEQVASGRLLLAFGMNGGPLPHRHGGPMRLIASGDFGEMNVKWVESLTWGPPILLHEDDGRELPAVPMAFATMPAWGAETSGEALRLAGVAYAGRQAVSRVPIHVNDSPRADAELLDPGQPCVWTRWQATLSLEPGDNVISIGCEDDLGRASIRVPIEDAWADLDDVRASHELRLRTRRS